MSKFPVFVFLAALAALTGGAVTAQSSPASQPNARCSAAETPLELVASGQCRCSNGSCVVLDCTADVGVTANVEALKGQLKATLAAKAKAINGQLVGEITFELHAKP